MTIDFKQWRLDKGLSQGEAAKLIGATHSTWSLLERGKKVSEAYKIAAAAVVGETVTIEIAAKPEPSTPVSSESVKPEATAIEPVSPIDFSNMQVRTQEFNGEIWFRLNDVCRTIDYANPANALRMIEEDDIQKLETIDAIGRTQETWFVSEPGLYQFLGASNMPKAKPFKRWVSKEVLPSIRKTGTYTSSQAPAAFAGDIPTWAAALLQQMGGSVVQVQAEMRQQQAQISEVREAVAAAPSQAADEVLARMQALETHKARLHDVVHSIVAKAKTLDQNDPDAQYWAQYANAWRSIHRYANPPVSKLAGYTHPDQIEHAILGGEAILARLGGPIGSKQMAMDLQGVAS